MRSGEQGEIITGWLLRMLAVVAVIIFIGYEVISIGVTVFQLDHRSREVARTARTAYRDSSSVETTTQAAEQAAEQLGDELVSLEVDGEELVLTLERDAPTLVVHRIGPLERFTRASVTTRISWPA